MPSKTDGTPREYRLDVRLPPELSQELDLLMAELKGKGVKTSRSQVVVTILSNWFASSKVSGNRDL